MFTKAREGRKAGRITGLGTRPFHGLQRPRRVGGVVVPILRACLWTTPSKVRPDSTHVGF